MGIKYIHIFLLSLVLLMWGCNQGQQTDPGEKSSEVANISSLPDTLQEASKNNSSVKNFLDAPQDSTLRADRHNAITEAVQKVSPAVVSITVTEVVEGGKKYNQFFDQYFIVPDRKFSSLGSGFIISKDGLVVTNEHVASANAKKIVVSLPDGSQYDASVIGTDELADIALLKIESDKAFPFIQFGNSDQVIVGEWSLAVGNPFGLFKAAQPSVTVGVISALHRDFRPNPDKPRVYLDMIQTDAAINSGNSGGPLVDSRGRLIGINTFIYTGGTGNGFVGLGFAIPSNTAKKIIEQLASSGEVKMPYDLGLETTPMTYTMAVQNKLPAIMGLFVSSVNRDGPAFKSGIVPGDIIIKIGDERVQSQMHAQALFREYEVGDSMNVQLLRDNKLYETKIKLRAKIRGN